MLHKVFKIISLILSALAFISLIFIIRKGDDAIEAAAKDGNTLIVEPIAIIGYLVLAIIIGLVLYFIIKNIISNASSLKNTLIGVGAFLGVLLISYLLTFGDSVKYKLNDEEFASDSTSHFVGAGLTAFYILIFAAIGAAVYSSVKKILNKN